MQTFLDSLHLAKDKMLTEKFEKMNTENHLSTVGNQNFSDEMTARPDDTEKTENPSSVHNSLAGIEEDDTLLKW